jgi:hypothetical protein
MIPFFASLVLGASPPDPILPSGVCPYATYFDGKQSGKSAIEVTRKDGVQQVAEKASLQPLRARRGFP